MQRRVGVLLLGVDVRALLYEQRGELAAAIVRCKHQWSNATAVLGFDIDAFFEQHLYAFLLAGANSPNVQLS